MTQTNDTVDFNAMTTEQLTLLRDSYGNNYKGFIEAYTADISELVKAHLEGCSVSRLDDYGLYIKVDDGIHSSELTVYHGYDHWAKYTDDIKFQLNVAAMGSFDILGTRYVQMYYAAVGEIINNKEFSLALKSLLKELADNISDIKDAIYEINNILNNREREERKAKAIADIKEEFAKTKVEIENRIATNDTKGVYVAICKTADQGLCNGVYRKCNVQILPIQPHGNEYDVWRKMYDTYYKNVYDIKEFNKKYKIIELSKVKLL